MSEKSLNKVLLIGRLGADPETKFVQTGMQVANFNLATTANWKDENGNLQSRTDWHRIVAWGKLAEICKEYLKKGSKVYIEGALQTRSYEDKDGQKRFITEIRANDMIMLDSKGFQENTTKVAASDVPGNDIDAPVEGTEPDDDLPF
ncbi:MAG TPA: single-stranded DNA-binding protein [Bacteroidota bacterium]|jgi:single-strand DNA-binding protein|nr:single-stranded DNA-binding protein [Bacteroidota bacterium]